MFFFVFGLGLLRAAHNADVHQTVIPGGGDAAWMYPWQGYAASFVCFAAAAFGIVIGLRLRKN